jgi:proline iminopeptidase
VDQAYTLHQAWPESRLSIIPAAGHSTSDPAMTDALIRATDGFAERLA